MSDSKQPCRKTRVLTASLDPADLTCDTCFKTFSKVNLNAKKQDKSDDSAQQGRPFSLVSKFTYITLNSGNKVTTKIRNHNTSP